MIQIKDISKSFINKQYTTNILKEITFSVNSGKWYSILGPSGSGKSTLLKCMAGLLKPDQGEVLYNGNDIYKYNEKTRNNFRKTTIGFIFQDFKLLPYYSVIDNVCLPLIHDQSKVELYKKAASLLEKVGISENLFTRLPEGLSGGEQQRVAIARALIANPAILICDEPTGNLDSENRDRIINLLFSIKAEGQTIVMVTHDHAVANYSDVILELKNGSIQEVEVENEAILL